MGELSKEIFYFIFLRNVEKKQFWNYDIGSKNVSVLTHDGHRFRQQLQIN